MFLVNVLVGDMCCNKTLQASELILFAFAITYIVFASKYKKIYVQAISLKESNTQLGNEFVSVTKTHYQR